VRLDKFPNHLGDVLFELVFACGGDEVGAGFASHQDGKTVFDRGEAACELEIEFLLDGVAPVPTFAVIALAGFKL